MKRAGLLSPSGPAPSFASSVISTSSRRTVRPSDRDRRSAIERFRDADDSGRSTDEHVRAVWPTADRPDQRARAHHAVIVAGGEGDFTASRVGLARRLGKGDHGRIVGDGLDAPIFRAASRSAHPHVAASRVSDSSRHIRRRNRWNDGAAPTAGIERQCGQRRRRSCTRTTSSEPTGTAIGWVLAALQIDRRFAGIGGRIDPGIQLRGDRDPGSSSVRKPAPGGDSSPIRRLQIPTISNSSTA
jgi:hypothetical protein